MSYVRNGSSLPPRLPSLSAVLNLLHRTSSHFEGSHPPLRPVYTLIALSYRGFWTSSGRASEPGIALDAAAALAYAHRAFPATPDCEVRYVLWGQSLGAGVAVIAAAAEMSKHGAEEALSAGRKGQSGGTGTEGPPMRLQGLVLETPFVSVRAMLTALYPQKWLPYRYLGPFLRNHWDSEAGLRGMRSSLPFSSAISLQDALGKMMPKVLILQAGKDELVPAQQGIELESLCRELDIDVRRLVVGGALHSEVMAKATGRKAVADFLESIAHD